MTDSPITPTPSADAPGWRGAVGDPRVEALLAKLDAHLERAADGGERPEPPDGFRYDAKGRMTPVRLIAPADELEDQTVRRILAFGLDLANQVARFRAHTADDLAALLDVLAEEYGRKRRGRKGNYQCVSYDGRLKVVIQVQDRIAFGPELQVARQLIDECIASWSDGARDELVALVQHAFEPDKDGAVNREAVFRLRRLAVDDPRWRKAQQAITDSIRVMGSASYVRLYLRGTPEQRWTPVPIDLASSWVDPDFPATAPDADAGPGQTDADGERRGD